MVAYDPTHPKAEQLGADEIGAQQGVVRYRHGNNRKRPQARGKVADRDASRRGPRCKQDEGALLTGKIEQMKQRAFVERADGDVLDDHGARGEGGRHRALLQRARRDLPRACELSPDSGEVALAGSFRANQND